MENNVRFINEDYDNWEEAFLKHNGLDSNFLKTSYKKDFELDKLKDVYEGADLVLKHINNKSKILLVTDYDCDGISSAVTLTRFFRDNLKYENFDTLVNRRKNGNGFNSHLMDEILNIHNKEPIGLIITADHGSANDKQFGILKLSKIDLLITDHHEIPSDLINPNVFINPMRKDSEYFQGISGCHTAFLLCVATWLKLGYDLSMLDNLLPYVAVSTVVDQMPMTNKHNRDCVKTGLRYINKRSDLNFEIFKSKAKIGHMIRSKDIGFKIGPFFNSGNRTDIENIIFEAFVLSDKDKVEDRFNYGLLNNQRRKNEQKKIMTEVKEQLTELYPDIRDVFGIALKIDSTFGIAGPIASSVGGDVNRPIIVFKESYNPEFLSGSGRSIIDVDVLSILKKLEKDRPDIVVKLGGHAKAFGIEICSSKIEEFRKLFSEYIKEEIKVIPKTTYDVVAKVKSEDIGLDMYYRIEELGPYGNNYSEPLFYSELEYVRHYNIGTGVSIEFKRTNKSTVNAIFFFSGSDLNQKLFSEMIKPGMRCKVIYNLNLDSYTQNDMMQYKISLDIKDLFLPKE